MPGFIEAKLRKEGISKGKSGKDLDRYVYGGMNNMGAMNGNKETAKGKAMQAKHDASAAAEDGSEDVPMMPSTRSRRKKPSVSDNDDDGGTAWGF